MRGMLPPSDTLMNKFRDEIEEPDGYSVCLEKAGQRYKHTCTQI